MFDILSQYPSPSSRRNFLALISSGLLMVGCNKPAESESKQVEAAGTGGDLPVVVATTGMLADMVSAIVGDHAEVIGLMGPGIDPHLYKPGASDVTALRKADAIIYNGLHLEGKMGELFEKMKGSGKPVFGVGDLLSAEQLLLTGGGEDHPDPHIWGDPLMWGSLAPALATELAKILPESSSALTSNGVDYAKKCHAINDWAVSKVAALPEDGRVLITSHDAFSYLGRACGLEVIGVQGISTVSEAGLADVSRTVDLIKERGVRAIFVESSVSPAVIESVSRDSGVAIGGELFSDAMGEPGEMMEIEGTNYDLGTYEGMMRHNVHLITTALSGQK